MQPQRLPIVDSDDGVWGDIIRQYLMKEHFNDDTNNAANGGHQKITIRAGTAAAGTAPLKFTSGTLLSSPEAGAIEFAGDYFYATQTSSSVRKKVAMYNDASGATGDVYYRDSSGYFTRLGIGSTGDILTVASGIPSWTASIVGKVLNNTNTVTLIDTNFTLQDDGDTTKQAKFQLSGITTGTTRTFTVPDANTTLVGTNVAQVLTAKTISGADNTITNVSLTTGVTGALPLENGGTGQTTQQAAINALAGTQVSGRYLRSNGTNTSLSAIVAADVPTLNQNTTGSAATLTTARTIQTNLASTSSASFNGSANITPGVTGNLAVTNGGTGRNTSATAYGIIAAGATVTAAQTTIAPGTSGQFMKSQGNLNWPVFSNITYADITGGGAPYDVSFMHSVGTRATGYGGNAMGTRLARNCTFTSVTFRCATADASGNLVVELRKNGAAVTGTSTTIAAASQVSGGTSTGSWSFSAGDILTVYITSVGTTPGTGLVADITGVTA